MLDFNLIRSSPEVARDALKKRGMDAPLDELIAKDKEWKELLQKIEQLRKQRNSISKEINEMIKKKESEEKIQEKKKYAKQIPQLKHTYEKKLREVEKQRIYLALMIPNIPHESVPSGKSAEENVVVKTVGKPKEFNFKAKHHHEIGEKLKILDFERGAKLSGERFTVLKGFGAVLERALINLMLDLHRKKGYIEIFPPLLVKPEIMTASGQLPKFEEDMYRLERDNLYAIPTAEVPLINLHREEIFEYKELPKYYTAYTPCFRREAGSHGKDTRGVIRQHQFNKVELIKLTHQEKSYEEHEKMLNDACSVLDSLELPYRIVLLCTADMGFASSKTYDIEVWFPSLNNYKEVSSVSNCEEFQARRANIKYRDKTNKFKFVHTLNGSGLAVGRTLAAILENYQREDEGVEVPNALRKYMGEIA